MEKVIVAIVVSCTACGNVEGLRAQDIYALQSRGSSSVYGLVTNARTGAPIAGATVLVGGKSTQTEGDGTYGIEGLAPIEATGAASVHGYQSVSLLFKLDSGANLRNFSLEPNGCGRSDCRPGEFCSGDSCVTGASLSGSVVSACTGQALEALVQIDGKAQCSTSYKGAIFDLRELTPGGWLTLSVGKTGYLPWSNRVTLQVGPNAVDAVRLTPEGGCDAEPMAAACHCIATNCQPSP